jgi:hypothetical protein
VYIKMCRSCAFSFADWICEGIFILTPSIHSWFLPGGTYYENAVCAQLVPLATLPCHSHCQFGEVQGDVYSCSNSWYFLQIIFIFMLVGSKQALLSVV